LPYATPLSYAPSAQLWYAGFWLRFGAAIIDGILVFIASACSGAVIGGILGAILFSAGPNRRARMGIQISGQVIGTVIGWLYFALMESSARQATLGMMACSIRVTDMNGGRISFGRATGRYFGKFLSQLTLLIGYMMAGWTEKKQAL